MRRTLTVILASDVAGYSRLVAHDEEKTIERFRSAATMFTELVKKYQGTIFNTAGDAILARFDSAVDATRCAIDIQDANNANNAQIEDADKLLFRIGIAIGDVLVAENGDLLGDAVNIAARLENVAEPGGICISDDVRAQVLNKIRVNVIDLGDQNLRNLPRAIRVFKLVSRDKDGGVGLMSVRRTRARLPWSWVASGLALVMVVGAAAAGYTYYYPWWSEPAVNEPFDVEKIPLVTDRVREILANYEQEPDFKVLVISRSYHGVSYGASSLDSAKREALDRCQQRDPKGYCRIYAIGNRVVMSRIPLPLPYDIRSTPLDLPLTGEILDLLGRSALKERVEAFLKQKNPKALAMSQSGPWYQVPAASQEEAARLAVERCSDSYQAPCLLISVDGFMTVQVPRGYTITQLFTLAAEADMNEADKKRIGEIYSGKGWRALARGRSKHWHAVSGMQSEATAVDEVLKLCRADDHLCTVHAISNFRIGNRKK